VPLTEQDVRDRIGLLCPPAADPALAPAELDQLVRQAKRADLFGNDPDAYPPWAPGVTYQVGSLVVPVVRNGLVYRASAISGTGVSGTATPAWPLTLAATVIDNPGANQVTWTAQAAAPWTPTWSITAAVHAGWLAKAAKAAERYRFTAGTDSFEANTLLEHCLTMADRFKASGGTAASQTLQPAGMFGPVWPGVIGN
jgi:hypothetical protein